MRQPTVATADQLVLGLGDLPTGFQVEDGGVNHNPYLETLEECEDPAVRNAGAGSAANVNFENSFDLSELVLLTDSSDEAASEHFSRHISAASCRQAHDLLAKSSEISFPKVADEVVAYRLVKIDCDEVNMRVNRAIIVLVACNIGYQERETKVPQVAALAAQKARRVFAEMTDAGEGIENESKPDVGSNQSSREQLDKASSERSPSRWLLLVLPWALVLIFGGFIFVKYALPKLRPPEVG